MRIERCEVDVFQPVVIMLESGDEVGVLKLLMWAAIEDEGNGPPTQAMAKKILDMLGRAGV